MWACMTVIVISVFFKNHIQVVLVLSFTLCPGCWWCFFCEWEKMYFFFCLILFKLLKILSQFKKWKNACLFSFFLKCYYFYFLFFIFGGRTPVGGVEQRTEIKRYYGIINRVDKTTFPWLAQRKERERASLADNSLKKCFVQPALFNTKGCNKAPTSFTLFRLIRTNVVLCDQIKLNTGEDFIFWKLRKFIWFVSQGLHYFCYLTSLVATEIFTVETFQMDCLVLWV